MNETIPFLDYSEEHRLVLPNFIEAASRIVLSGRFALGPEVEAFETDYAASCGAKHAVAVNSGTSALVVALLAAGVGQGEEVIVPAMTFVATATAVLAVGATPVLVDVSPETFCLDVDRLPPALSDRTRAILPVHLYGQLADMSGITLFAQQHGLTVIEDAAQSHGASRSGRKAGSFGDAGCFSFYPGKNLGGAGEGGMVVTNDTNLAARAAKLRDWGQSKKGEYGLPGSNYRMDALQAAFLNLKLPLLDEWNAARRAVASQYNERLYPILSVTSRPRVDETNVFHIYPVFHRHRDRIRSALAARGVVTNVHYPKALHQQPALRGYRIAGDLAVSEMVAKEQLSLPIFPTMSSQQVDRVCHELAAVVDA